jgi:hypothetical protein
MVITPTTTLINAPMKATVDKMSRDLITQIKLKIIGNKHTMPYAKTRPF